MATPEVLHPVAGAAASLCVHVMLHIHCGSGGVVVDGGDVSGAALMWLYLFDLAVDWVATIIALAGLSVLHAVMLYLGDAEASFQDLVLLVTLFAVIRERNNRKRETER